MMKNTTVLGVASAAVRNLFGWMRPTVYSASTKQTYGTHAEATKDRLSRQSQ